MLNPYFQLMSRLSDQIKNHQRKSGLIEGLGGRGRRGQDCEIGLAQPRGVPDAPRVGRGRPRWIMDATDSDRIMLGGELQKTQLSITLSNDK